MFRAPATEPQFLRANPEVWVAVMMAEELKLAPIDEKAPRREAAIVGLSALLAGRAAAAPTAGVSYLLPARLRSSMIARSSFVDASSGA